MFPIDGRKPRTKKFLHEPFQPAKSKVGTIIREFYICAAEYKTQYDLHTRCPKDSLKSASLLKDEHTLRFRSNDDGSINIWTHSFALQEELGIFENWILPKRLVIAVARAGPVDLAVEMGKRVSLHDSFRICLIGAFVTHWIEVHPSRDKTDRRVGLKRRCIATQLRWIEHAYRILIEPPQRTDTSLRVHLDARLAITISTNATDGTDGPHHPHGYLFLVEKGVDR